MLLKEERTKEAETIYWENLRRYPENGWAHFGVWQSLFWKGKEAHVAQVGKHFQKACVHADTKFYLIDGYPTSYVDNKNKCKAN